MFYRREKQDCRALDLISILWGLVEHEYREFAAYEILCQVLGFFRMSSNDVRRTRVQLVLDRLPYEQDSTMRAYYDTTPCITLESFVWTACVTLMPNATEDNFHAESNNVLDILRIARRYGQFSDTLLNKLIFDVQLHADTVEWIATELCKSPLVKKINLIGILQSLVMTDLDSSDSASRVTERRDDLCSKLIILAGEPDEESGGESDEESDEEPAKEPTKESDEE